LINNFDENEKTKTKIILDGIVDGDGLFYSYNKKIKLISKNLLI
jgi:hypothetical protein